MQHANCAIDDPLGEYREPTYKLAAYKDDGWNRKEVGIDVGLQPEGIASNCRKVCNKRLKHHEPTDAPKSSIQSVESEVNQ